MGWDLRGSRHYYYRSRKVRGRVLREYVGGGERGEQAAAADARKRAELATKFAEQQEERSRLCEMDRVFRKLVRVTKQAMECVLNAHGFWRHHNEWRRKRKGIND